MVSFYVAIVNLGRATCDRLPDRTLALGRASAWSGRPGLTSTTRLKKLIETGMFLGQWMAARALVEP